MQQMFRCHKCGWQNVIGQRFCGSCGEIFQYNCPYCNNIVDPSLSACPYCQAALIWGFQQQVEPLPEQQAGFYQEYYQQQSPQQPPPAERQQPKKQKGELPKSKEDLLKQKKKSKLIVIIALIGLLICIGAAIYLTINTLSQPESPAAPYATSDNNSAVLPSEFIIPEIVIT